MVKLSEDSQVIICALLQHKFERMKTLKGQNFIKIDMESFLTSLIKDNSKTRPHWVNRKKLTHGESKVCFK